MQVKEKVLIFIPMETKAREFHAKFLLACVAAEAGFNVILGHKSTIKNKLKSLPVGICIHFIAKSNYYNEYKYYRDNKTRVVALDEEGLVFLNKDVYQKYSVSNEVLSLSDIFFAWGKVQAEIIAEKAPEASDKIVMVGNPRFDLLRHEYRNLFEDEVSLLRSRYGPFILINSSFGSYNHYYGHEVVIDQLKTKGFIKSKDEEAFQRRRIDFQGQLFHGFVEMLPQLEISYPNYNIIIRPHPSENFKRWENETKKLSNVKVIHEGNVIPWLMASEAMIHNGCTTGVEAYILNVPVIAYRPALSDEFDIYLPNSLSVQVFNKNELISALRNVFAKSNKSISPFNESQKYKEATDYITGLNGPLATERIVNSLRGLKVKPVELDFSQDIFVFKSVFLKKAKGIISNIINAKSSSKGYTEQKYPKIRLIEVENILKKLQNVSGRFNNIRIKEIYNSCFFIEENQK
jgi:surface carbohydrate biosynthesis protein